VSTANARYEIAGQQRGLQKPIFPRKNLTQ